MDASTAEAVAALRTLRERADREGLALPALAGVALNCTVAAYNAAHQALNRVCYYDVGDEASVREDRVARIDRAIATLEAQP